MRLPKGVNANQENVYMLMTRPRMESGVRA